ncbi:MAG: YcjF family protein [Clostridia bacterium]|nr:YcjF family protein [Clostridia bacterium]
MEKNINNGEVSANEKKNSSVNLTTDGKEEKVSGKLSIYEYEQKYTKRQNVRGAKLLLKLICAVIGLFLFACLFFVSKSVYDMNEYAGYATGGVCVILYIVLFIVPMVKILKSPYFIVNVNAKTAGAAKKHNRKVRREIADKIIDLTAKVDGVGWYNSKTVGELAIAVKAGSDEGIMNALTSLYTGSVKKSAKDMIFKSSMKSAMYSALSQTSKVDAALVVFLNLQLVKDIVFLYGFRPSDAKLVKIFGRVFQNSLIAYGLGGLKIGNSIVKTMGDAVRGIPLLGSAISAIVDSSVQGLTNGVLTAVMGYQTIRYLSQEYKLQQILDGVELVETEEEIEETCQKIEKELKSGKKPQAA